MGLESIAFLIHRNVGCPGTNEVRTRNSNARAGANPVTINVGMVQIGRTTERSVHNTAIRVLRCVTSPATLMTMEATDGS
jgi:hypothetical protein